MLADSDAKEQLSKAYIWLLATQAGFTADFITLDRDSIDVTLNRRSGRRPSIDGQLKCTSSPKIRNKTTLVFSLSKKNYDDLRIETINPRYLFVLRTHKKLEKRVNVAAALTKVRYAAYYLSLKGQPDVLNKSDVTIEIPLANHLTPETLRALMDKAEEI